MLIARPALLALATLGLTAASSVSAEAAFPGHNGSLAFARHSVSDQGASSSTDSTDDSIQDSSGRTLRGCSREPGRPDVGDCSVNYSDPAYSPGGSEIVFGGGSAFGLMDSAGGHFRKLSTGAGVSGSPAFSPHATQIVFTRYSSGQSSARADLYVMRVSTGHTRRLTQRGGDQPVWSSKGEIAFRRGRDLFVVNPSGRGLRRVTYRGGFSPAWSPYATKLLFVRGSLLYTVSADGRGLGQVPGSYPSPSATAWSPDGQRIAFESGGSGLYTARADGRGCCKSGPFEEDTDAFSENGSIQIRYSAPDWQPRPYNHG